MFITAQYTVHLTAKTVFHYFSLNFHKTLDLIYTVAWHLNTAPGIQTNKKGPLETNLNLEIYILKFLKIGVYLNK